MKPLDNLPELTSEIRQGWRLWVIFLTATGCAAARAAMATGQVADPLPLRLPYVPLGTVSMYLIVPMVVALILKERPFSWMRLGHSRRGVPLFVLGLLGILLATFVVSHLASFRSFYGSLPEGRTLDLVVGYLVAVACVEFLFRGFLLLPVYRRLGWLALPVAAAPYCLTHIGKPAVELFGSVAVGLGLSYLAVVSGSIIYGIALHWLLAVALHAWPTLLG